MIDMRCNVRQIYAERPIDINGKTVLIHINEFKRIKGQAYIDVLTKGFQSVSGISKSYYYYILNRLKRLGLIDESDRITFKYVIPYEVEDDLIRLGDEFLISIPPFIFLVTRERGNHNTESLLNELIAELSGKKYKKGDMCEKLTKIVKESLKSYVLNSPLLVGGVS